MNELDECDCDQCEEKAVAFNDDGAALCEDCLCEWGVNELMKNG